MGRSPPMWNQLSRRTLFWPLTSRRRKAASPRASFPWLAYSIRVRTSSSYGYRLSRSVHGNIRCCPPFLSRFGTGHRYGRSLCEQTSNWTPMTTHNPKVDPAPVSNTEKDPDDWVSGDEPMTGAQASYLKTLTEQLGVPDEFSQSLTKAEAS